MRLQAFTLIMLAVALVSVGQALFKYVSILINQGNPVLGYKVIGYTILSFGISGSSTLVWIYLLRSMELAKAYPFMALSFVVVPLLGAALYGDNLSLAYFAGLSLVLSGIFVITRFS